MNIIDVLKNLPINGRQRKSLIGMIKAGNDKPVLKYLKRLGYSIYTVPCTCCLYGHYIVDIIPPVDQLSVDLQWCADNNVSTDW